MNENQIKELILEGIEVKVEKIVKPLIQSKLDKEINSIVNRVLGVNKENRLDDIVKQHLFKRIDSYFTHEKMDELLADLNLEKELKDKLVNKIYKNLKLYLMG